MFAPQVLVPAGVICLVLGLCLWLDGLRWARITVAFLGGLGGGLCAWFITNHQVVPIAAAVVIFAGLSLFFQKQVFVLTGSLVAALVGIIIITAAAQREQSANYQSWEINGEVTMLTVSETLEVMKLQLASIGEGFGKDARSISAVSFMICILAGLVVLVAGIFMTRFVMALTSATLGTALVFGGMIFLLLFKGSAPIRHIYAKSTYYIVVALVMTGFGTVIELLLCPGRKKKTGSKKTEQGDKK